MRMGHRVALSLPSLSNSRCSLNRMLHQEFVFYTAVEKVSRLIREYNAKEIIFLFLREEKIIVNCIQRTLLNP